MAIPIKCFAAYPSNLPGKGDAIEAAISVLNGGQAVEVTGWKDLESAGRPIIGRICEEIDKSDLIIADITNLNPNVLYEVGYALAKRKRIWIIFNPRVSGAKLLFENFQLFTTIYYADYSNSQDIVEKIYKDKAYEDLGSNLFDELLKNRPKPVAEDALVYLKPSENTESVVRIARRVANAPIAHIIDDPREIRVQPLEWYVANVSQAAGVICHFLSDSYEDVRISNAKAALVAGLTSGLGKSLLMLAHEPYMSPIDYRDLMKTHSNANRAEAFYQEWLSPILESEKNRAQRRTRHTQQAAGHTSLISLNIGEPIAEFESDSIPEYFVPTAAYADALSRQHSIFVGRKGTGKSATLLKIQDELRADPRNLICVIKPIDYELDGMIALMRTQLSVSEKGYLVESLWKALIYTELAKSVYERIKSRSQYAGFTPEETALISFVEANEQLILPEFSTRLEAFVARVSESTSNKDGRDAKQKISEAIHRQITGNLRDLLLGALDKSNTITVLVDNLDKNWNARTDIQLVSELLFGLLSVSLRIEEEFKKSSLGRRRLDVSMTIFLRSDIYAAIVSYAREPDKLPIRRIEWSDEQLLARVIETRFLVADQKLVDANEVWTKYFTQFVGSVPTRNFLIKTVFPRPRDLIYLVRASQQNAINRGHSKIEEDDIESACTQYSSFLLSSLMAEGSPQFRNLEDFMTELFGGPTILTQDLVREALEACDAGFDKAEYVIDLLFDLGFFAYEVAPDRFEFCLEKDQKARLGSLSRRTSRQIGQRRFLIHPAFHAFLELKATDSKQQISFAFAESHGV